MESMKEVVDTAIGAEGPVGFVLQAGNVLAAVLLVPCIGALDDAARTAGVVVDFFALALFDPIEDRLAGDLGGAFEATAGEVACRQPAGLVHDVDQNRRAVSVQPALGLGDVMILQGLGHLLAALIEKGFIRDRRAGRLLAVQDDELDAFAGEHRTQPTATGVAGGALFLVVEDHASVAVAVFTCHATTADGDLFAKSLVNLREYICQWFAAVFCGVEKLDLRLFCHLVPGQMQTPELILVFGLSLQHQRPDLQVRQVGAPRSAGIGLLDAAGEGRLGAYRDAR